MDRIPQEPLIHDSHLSDTAIIELYHQRDEAAIAACEQKYGRYCHIVAERILHNPQDAEECVNDTWIEAWSVMPPKRPTRLGGFLAAITRHLALDRMDHMHAKKRNGIAEVADEFWDCVPDREESVTDEIIFRERLNAFLSSLDRRTRVVFMQRYWYLCPVREIATRMDMSESAVKTLLHRTRAKFKVFLEKEGISV